MAETVAAAGETEAKIEATKAAFKSLALGQRRGGRKEARIRPKMEEDRLVVCSGVLNHENS